MLHFGAVPFLSRPWQRILGCRIHLSDKPHTLMIDISAEVLLNVKIKALPTTAMSTVALTPSPALLTGTQVYNPLSETWVLYVPELLVPRRLSLW